MSDSEDPREQLRAQIIALRGRIDPRLLESVRQAYLSQLQGEREEQANAKQAVELYLQEKRKNAALLQQLVKQLKGIRKK